MTLEKLSQTTETVLQSSVLRHILGRPISLAGPALAVGLESRIPIRRASSVISAHQLNWHWERILSCVRCRMFGDVTGRKCILQAVLWFQVGILRQKFAGKLQRLVSSCGSSQFLTLRLDGDLGIDD